MKTITKVFSECDLALLLWAKPYVSDKNVSQWRALTLKKANYILGRPSQDAASTSREVILHIQLALVGLHLLYRVHFGASQYQKRH